MTATFTRTATANTFSATASYSLTDSTTGALSGNPLASISNPSLVDAPTYNDTSTFAGFRAAGTTNNGSPSNGANLMDNFSVVPEPSTMALSAISGLGLLGMLRRRVRAGAAGI